MDEKKPTKNLKIANDNHSIEIGIANAIISSINHKMYGFPPFQFNQNIENEEYQEYFHICNDWLDYLRDTFKSTFPLSVAIDKFVFFHRKRRSKRNMQFSKPNLNESSNLKNKISNIYNNWNLEYFTEKLKVILSICQSLYIIQNLVDDLWKFTGGAHLAKESDNHKLEQKLLKKRSQVVKEIYQTEEAYTNDIEILVNSFMIPLKNNKIIKTVDTFGIFSNIKEILRIHQTFCNKLYQRFEDTKQICKKMKLTNKIDTSSEDKSETNKEEGEEDEDNNQSLEELTFQQLVIGDLFEEFASELKIYVEYCNNYNVSSKLTEELKFRDQNYLNFVTTCAIPHKKSLETYLIKPVQRVYRYELLLERVSEATPESHKDKDLITKAIKEIHDTAVFLDKNQKKMSKFRMKQLFQKKQEKFRVSTLRNNPNFTKTRTKASESLGDIGEDAISNLRSSSTLRGKKKKVERKSLERSISLPSNLYLYFCKESEDKIDVKKELTKEEVIESLKRPLDLNTSKRNEQTFLSSEENSLFGNDSSGGSYYSNTLERASGSILKIRMKSDSPGSSLDVLDLSPLSNGSISKLEELEIQNVDPLKKFKGKNRNKGLSIGNIHRKQFLNQIENFSKIELSKIDVEKMKEEISQLPINKIRKKEINKPSPSTTPSNSPPPTPLSSPPLRRKSPNYNVSNDLVSSPVFLSQPISTTPVYDEKKLDYGTKKDDKKESGKRVEWKSFFNGKKDANSTKETEEDLPRKRSFTSSFLDRHTGKKGENDPFEQPFSENTVEIHSPNPLPKFDFSSLPKTQNVGRYNDVKKMPPLDLENTLSRSSDTKLSPVGTSPKGSDTKISPKKVSPKRSEVKSMDLSPRDLKVSPRENKKRKSPRDKSSKKKDKKNNETSIYKVRETPISLKEANPIISPRSSREFKKTDLISQMSEMLAVNKLLEKRLSSKKFNVETKSDNKDVSPEKEKSNENEDRKTIKEDKKEEKKTKKQISKTLKSINTKEIISDDSDISNTKMRSSVSIIDSGEFILKTKKQSKDDLEILFLASKYESSAFPGVDVKTMRKKKINRKKFLELLTTSKDLKHEKSVNNNKNEKEETD